MDIFLSGSAPVREASELIDHIPCVPRPEETPPEWLPFFDGFDFVEAQPGNETAQKRTKRFATATEPGSDVHEVLITHAYPVARHIRHALDAPAPRWLRNNSANAALTVIEYQSGLPPSIILFNDMSHLPSAPQWTGFPETLSPDPRPHGSFHRQSVETAHCSCNQFSHNVGTWFWPLGLTWNRSVAGPHHP